MKTMNLVFNTTEGTRTFTIPFAKDGITKSAAQVVATEMIAKDVFLPKLETMQEAYYEETVITEILT